MLRLRCAGAEKNGKVIQMGNVKKDKRIKNESSIAFSLRLNRLPVPKIADLDWRCYSPAVQYGLGIARWS
jgi:hypothetical protein